MKNSSGFTLVEVLIAMLVLATGLLGLAGLQATSLGNNLSAYNRSQATQFVYDLADRIRANSSALDTYSTIAPADAVENQDCLITTGCSPADMAQQDLFEWNRMLESALPNNNVTIVTAPGGMITITISWDENRDGTIDVDDPNFQTSFRL